jgi:hypothetical protein
MNHAHAETPAAKPPCDRSRRWAAVLLLLASAASAIPASGQCLISSGPNNVFANANWPTGFTSIGAYDAIAYAGGTRLYANVNFGFGIYDLAANPAVPSNLGWVNLIALLGFHCGDGQTDITSSAISTDGNRLIVSLTEAASCHGNTLVFVPGSGLFQIKGDFVPPRAQVVVQQVGGRYIGYAMPPSAIAGNLRAADITNPPGWSSTPGYPSPSKGNIASEQNANFPGGTRFQLADNYLFYLSGTSVRVIDARNPGPAGSITTGFTRTDIPLPAWGRGAGETIGAFGAAVDPASGGSRIYLVAEFRNSSSNSTGFTLLKLEGGTPSVVGTFSPPAPYSGAGSYPGDSISLQGDALTSDINVLMWTKSKAAGATPPQYVLYSTSVNSWSRGSAFLASNPVDGSVFGGGKMSVFKRSGNETDVYLADGNNAWAVKLGCTPPNSPAGSSLKVEPVPCPGGSASCPLADGATVFLGDTLKISPFVTPPDAFKPVNGWRFDYDFHPGSTEDSGSSYPRLAQPDESGSGNPPASYTLVGPCDKSAGGDPATGSNCWNSVRNNASFGGPDFSGTPAAGATKSLQIAFEANNELGSANRATQNLTWQVPAARLASPAVLAGAALKDGSDGHPSGSGHKWYFGMTPGAPPGETLSRDGGCTGPSCTHAFPGPGTYNVWLTVPYPTGFTTPDCGTPCTAPAGGLTVKVTELAPALKVGGLTTPPTTLTYTAGQVTIEDAGTQKAPGVTITGYRWCLAVAPAVCDPAGFPAQTFGSLPAQIPLPPTGTYNLSVKVYYTGGTASPVDWTPNAPGADSPRAWRLNVVAPPPQIVFVSGASPCGGFCPDSYAIAGTQVTAKVVVDGTDAGGPGSSWSILPGTAASPSSGNGATFAFTPTAEVDLQLTLVDGGQTARRTITILAPPPLVVTASASPTSAAAGASIGFSAAASGGTGSYVTYSWDFGDGGTGSGASVSHAYSSANAYTATCTVTDSLGKTKSATVSVTVTSGASRFYTVAPCRVFDSRNASGPDAAAPALLPQSARVLAVAGRCGIPTTAAALSANVTVIAPAAPGFLTLYPGNSMAPTASSINFGPGQTRANNAVVKLSTDGALTLGILNGSVGAVHFVLDVNGYFR